MFVSKFVFILSFFFPFILTSYNGPYAHLYSARNEIPRETLPAYRKSLKLEVASTPIPEVGDETNIMCYDTFPMIR